jgi:hypothetical protein
MPPKHMLGTLGEDRVALSVCAVGLIQEAANGRIISSLTCWNHGGHQSVWATGSIPARGAGLKTGSRGPAPPVAVVGVICESLVTNSSPPDHDCYGRVDG